MKEHKNPKVLSEGILWMVSAVEDFGVSHLKLKVLIVLFLTSESLSVVILVNYHLVIDVDMVLSFTGFD